VTPDGTILLFLARDAKGRRRLGTQTIQGDFLATFGTGLVAAVIKPVQRKIDLSKKVNPWSTGVRTTGRTALKSRPRRSVVQFLYHFFAF